MRHAVAVERPVGVGHVDAGLEQAAGEQAPGGGLAGPRERLVAGLAPDIRPVAEPLERLERERVVGQDAERRNHVFPEVLVLVVAPHEYEIGAKGGDLVPQGTERAEHPRPMRLE